MPKGRGERREEREGGRGGDVFFCQNLILFNIEKNSY
jgi:hypothetical protein